MAHYNVFTSHLINSDISGINYIHNLYSERKISLFVYTIAASCVWDEETNAQMKCEMDYNALRI